MKKKNLLPLILIGLFSLSACDSGDDSDKANSGTPATGHHENDKVTDNGDSTFSVTLANNTFTTKSPNFSTENKVTDAKTVSAVKKSEYVFSHKMKYFKVDGDFIYGSLEESAFNSYIYTHSLVDNKKVTTHAPDSRISGMDYNGVIMTVDGAEDINFYQSSKGLVNDHFFTIKSFRGSKFLSACYIDGANAYVYNSDEILSFKLEDTTKVTKLNLTIPDFSKITFSSDESYLYISIGDINNSTVIFSDKSNNYIQSDKIDIPNTNLSGITVDANYIYLSDSKNGKVLVYNKHTKNASGSFSVTSPSALHKVGNMLYVSNEGDKKVEKYEISFN